MVDQLSVIFLEPFYSLLFPLLVDPPTSQLHYKSAITNDGAGVPGGGYRNITRRQVADSGARF